ncbi:MAG: signal peptide peptidase SppA [Candidatus Eisenbacteria bacterium]
MAGRRSLIALLVFFGILIALAALIIVVFMGRAPAIREGSYLRLTLKGQLAEEASGFLEMPFLEREQITLKTVLDCIEKAKVDKRIKGIVVEISPLAFGWGKVQEIRDKLAWFRETSGKPVVAYLVLGGDKEYYLASVCEKVFMPEASRLLVDGLASEVTFFRGTLDKLGITPDLEHIGSYKSASDILTQRSFTEAHREVTNAILDDSFNRLVTTIAQARGFTEREARKIIDAGSFEAREAYERGLVDSLIYEDQLCGTFGIEKEEQFKTISLEDYARVKLPSLGLGKGPKIALVYAVGTITEGKSSFSPVWGRTMGSETMIEALRQARTDKDVRAIVLRIDSPGGSGTASDLIWRETKRARESKPFIASMSDMAGSGGYYIAMSADTIVAGPGTYTGSIGVVSGKFVTRGLYDKLGMTRELVTRGENAAMYSDARPFTVAERRKLMEQLWAWYTAFVQKAAEGRRMEEKAVDKVGRGRVWTGAQAAEVGLVDVVGGLERALEIAKVKAGIPKDEQVTVVIYPKKKISLIQKLMRTFSTEAISWALTPELRQILELVHAQSSLRAGEPHYVMPYQIDTR